MYNGEKSYKILGASLPKGFECLLGREIVKPFLPSNNFSIDACIEYKSIDELMSHFNSVLPHVLTEKERNESGEGILFSIGGDNKFLINIKGKKARSYDKWDNITVTDYEKETFLSVPFYRNDYEKNKIDHQNVLLVKYLLESARLIK